MTKFEHTKWANPADAEEYRDNAEHYLPERRVLLSVLTSFYRRFVAPLSSKRVLDLGCGDGIIAATLGSEDPNITMCMVDGSADMIEAAKKRLAASPVEEMRCATFQQLIAGKVALGRFDFVVSGFAIHHLDLAEKRNLFHWVFDSLNGDSYFVNMDVVRPISRVQEDWYYALWREWIGRHQHETGLAESFAHVPAEARRLPENFYDTLDDQLEALRQVGFTEVECHYRYGLFGLYSGRKP